MKLKALLLFVVVALAGNCAMAQFDLHGGYSLVMERADKTTILMHGGHIDAGYNFHLVEQLGIRTGASLHMTMLTQNSLSYLRSKNTQAPVRVDNPSNKEIDIVIPAQLNYSFDPGSQLHFNVFIGPSIGLTINELKAVTFTNVNYVNAAKHPACAINLALDMGLEFRFRQFGLRIAFNREMVSSGHTFSGKHSIKRDMLTLGVAYHFGDAPHQAAPSGGLSE